MTFSEGEEHLILELNAKLVHISDQLLRQQNSHRFMLLRPQEFAKHVTEVNIWRCCVNFWFKILCLKTHAVAANLLNDPSNFYKWIQRVFLVVVFSQTNCFFIRPSKHSLRLCDEQG